MGLFNSLGGESSLPPEIVMWGQLDGSLFVLAVGTDQALWYARLDGYAATGGTWGPWQSLGGTVMSAPRAVRSGESSVDVFAAGAHSELLHWQFRDNAWTEWPVSIVNRQPALAQPVVWGGPGQKWESLGGIILSAPHAVMFGELGDEILVFAVGTDHALWVKAYANGSWRDWATLGHTLSSPPCAVTWQRETFVVFARGTDSAIWYTMGSDWISLGGAFSSAPYAVSTSGHIHVFAADTQSALSHCSWDGSSWSSWESLGGILMSAPTANGFPEGDLIHVHALGTDSAIWRRQLVGASWNDWESLGGPFLSPPATVARSPGSAPARELAALGTDHAVWHAEQFDP